MARPPRNPAFDLPGMDSPAAHWFLDQLFKQDRFAHHPSCRCYDHHLLRLGRLNLCLGCVCLGSGMLAGILTLGCLFVLNLAWLEALGTGGLVGFGTTCYLPALVQPFFQRKWFKILARFSLGFGIPLMWFGAMVLLPYNLLGAGLRVLFVLIFLAVWRATQIYRGRFTSRPCDSCPTGPGWPLCEDQRPRVLALVEQLQQRAQPEDQPFLNLVLAMVGLKKDGPTVEIITLGTKRTSPEKRT